MSNSFGKIFRITTFGESHGAGIGVVIDGCPAGIAWDEAFIQHQLDRRKPGQSAITTQRKESDIVEVWSGVFEGYTTGTPIMLLLRNENAKSSDYEHLRNLYRPSHADYTYDAKYGRRDHRGGGRSSARETAARVAAGAVAQLLLRKYDIQFLTWVDSIGSAFRVPEYFTEFTSEDIESNEVRCPHPETAERMIAYIKEVRKQGDTVGGTIKSIIRNVPAGWGEPVFDKLHAQLGKAILSINACKGFEYGSGFAGTKMRGSEHNDLFYLDNQGKIATYTNYSGGIQGGISNGQEIYFRCAFKPVATLQQKQETVDKDGNPVTFIGKGRHDPCVLPRAVPIVEAMSALVLADFSLRASAQTTPS
jgi:chorismate synthase